MLSISRPSLIQLLDEGKMEFRKIGTHRRVRFESVIAYKRRLHAERLAALHELAAYDQEIGIWFVATFGAFFDANVLYPSGLRNFLMHLALTGSFRAHWSADVHEEWMRNLLKNRPDLTREKLKRTRHLMEHYRKRWWLDTSLWSTWLSCRIGTIGTSSPPRFVATQAW
jgi:excisionase family DNA binding protein